MWPYQTHNNLCLCKCAQHAKAPILAVPAALEAPFATAALQPCLLTGTDVFTLSETPRVAVAVFALTYNSYDVVFKAHRRSA